MTPGPTSSGPASLSGTGVWSAPLRYGDFEALVIDDAQRVYAFARTYQGDTVYCAFNASDAAATGRTDVQRVYTNLRTGSQHHLAAFTS